MDKPGPDWRQRLLWLIDRIPDCCVIETDRAGILTWFGPAAEEFFGCPAAEALDRLSYRDFHDPAELAACQDDPVFRSAMETRGWTEDDWTVIPRRGDRFRARVTLLRRPAQTEGAPEEGWIALYRRLR